MIECAAPPDGLDLSAIASDAGLLLAVEREAKKIEAAMKGGVLPSKDDIRLISFLVGEVRRRIESLTPEQAAEFEAMKKKADTRETRRWIQALVAETESSASAPAVLRLRTGEAPAGAANKLYVLAVGVSSYAQPALKLGFSAKDAGDFSHVMAAHDRLYSGAEMRVLDDAHARRADVLAGLAWLKMAPGPGDVAMLFLSGHGAADASGAYYYLPQDADPTDLRGTAISNRDLIDAVSRIRGKVVLFLDTCHAGAALSARADGLVNQLISAENGAVVFASSTGEQVSLESPQWGNGAFTKELVVGLAGGADLFRHGNVSVADLNSWLSEKVPELTNHRQVPAFASPNTIPNFIIAQ